MWVLTTTRLGRTITLSLRLSRIRSTNFNLFFVLFLEEPRLSNAAAVPRTISRVFHTEAYAVRVCLVEESDLLSRALSSCLVRFVSCVGEQQGTRALVSCLSFVAVRYQFKCTGHASMFVLAGPSDAAMYVYGVYIWHAGCTPRYGGYLLHLFHIWFTSQSFLDIPQLRPSKYDKWLVGRHHPSNGRVWCASMVCEYGCYTGPLQALA